jgi:hypothetical protein
LLTQVLRADRVERLDRVSDRDLDVSVLIPGENLFASVTVDRNLVVWGNGSACLPTNPLSMPFRIGESPRLSASRNSRKITPLPREPRPAA